MSPVTDNPHRYQYEKMGAAISNLMAPDHAFEEKLADAMAEFLDAFGTIAPSDSARIYADTIRRLMRDEPPNQRARALTPSQRAALVKAFWELDRAVSRDYYTDEAHRR